MCWARTSALPGSRAFDAIGEVTGTSFAVWAPNARAVRVVGDFNDWDGRGHAMRSLGELRRLGAVRPGRRRRARGTSSRSSARDGHWRQKADPMAFATEVPPRTASVVTESTYEWQDDEWLRRRATTRRRTTGPMSVYEVHLGSWRQGLSYRELADQLVELRQGPGLHPRRVPAGGRAPVRRLLGLPGHRLLRADAPVRHARRLPVPRRPPAPGRHRRDRRLGARALPQGRVGAGPLRRHAAVRARRPAPRRAPRLGHARLQLRPARGAQLPRRQRAVLARGVPRRRPAGRRRRLDALPRLLAQRRRVGAQRVRRPREPRGDRLPAGDQRHRLPARTRAS